MKKKKMKKNYNKNEILFIVALLRYISRLSDGRTNGCIITGLLASHKVSLEYQK